MPTYEDGYRKGVEDALKSFQDHEVWGMIIPTNSSPGTAAHAVEIFDALAAKRKKELLTKKVTKWTFAFYDTIAKLTPRFERETFDLLRLISTLFNSKE